MPDLTTGGCACGKVRYELTGTPAFVAHCHCRDCQQASGGQMATVAGLPRANFRLTLGQTRSYRYPGGSGKGLSRHFCPDCGSRLFTDELGILPDMMFVAVGSLDHPGSAVPSMHIFTASAQPWATISDGMACYPGMPG